MIFSCDFVELIDVKRHTLSFRHLILMSIDTTRRECGSISDQSQSQSCSSEIQEDLSSELVCNSTVLDGLDCHESGQMYTEAPSTTSDIRQNSARFLLQLKEAKGLSQTAVDTVVEGCQQLVDECLRNVHMDIKNKIHDAGQLEMIDDAFLHCTQPFDGLQNEYQQEKFYVEHFNMIVSVLVT